jgi:hypothetical protein
MTFHCRLIAVISFMALAGCCVSHKDEKGTQHYLIIGLGMLSLSEKDDAVLATRLNSIGISLSNRPDLRFGLGYTSSMAVSIVPYADTLVEISQKPGDPITINSTFESVKERVQMDHCQIDERQHYSEASFRRHRGE